MHSFDTFPYVIITSRVVTNLVNYFKANFYIIFMNNNLNRYELCDTHTSVVFKQTKLFSL
jgi:hypothetical protein